MSTTPNYDWPVPDPTDPPNIPKDLGDLANAADADLNDVATRVTDVETRVTGVEGHNGTQDDRLTSVDSQLGGLNWRLTRAENAFRGNVKVHDLVPHRTIESTTMSEILTLRQTLTFPLNVPLHVTHYIINVNMHVVTDGDFRFGVKVGDNQLGYWRFRPNGAVPGTGALVYQPYYVPVNDYEPGDYPVTYWACNDNEGQHSEIHSAIVWATLA